MTCLELIYCADVLNSIYYRKSASKGLLILGPKLIDINYATCPYILGVKPNPGPHSSSTDSSVCPYGATYKSL